MNVKIVSASALVALTGLVAAASPALSDDAATLGTSVRPVIGAVPCIEIDTTRTGPAVIDFGEGVLFSFPSEPITTGPSADSVPDYRSCSTGSQDVSGRVTTMTNAAGTVTWTPGSACPALNQFGMALDDAGERIELTLDDVKVETTLGPSVRGINWQYLLTMPCQASDGGGQAMSGQVIFTAVLD